MTREEAIKRFETLLLHVDTDCVMGMETTEAINMAISALKAQNAPDTNVGSNDDTIYRQMAIELIERMKPYHQDADDIAEMIANMPSAQPNLQPTCSQLATDTISRQMAIDIVRKLSVKEVTPAYMLIDKTDAMTELMMLPSAQPDNRLSKIADLVEGTIDHFDLDDAMDLLYQIKEVLK